MATVGVKGLSSGGRSTGSVYVRTHADEELRQRMCSHTDEFCETVETLLEMHQSRLMTSLSAAALITTDDTDLMSPADTHYHVGSVWLLCRLLLTLFDHCCSVSVVRIQLVTRKMRSCAAHCFQAL